MEQHGAPTNVLSDGIHDAVELANGYRYVILNGQVKVVDVLTPGFDGDIGQRDDRRDAMEAIASEFFSISEATHPKALPNSGGTPCDMSYSHIVHRT
jgi:hypothetical protein